MPPPVLHIKLLGNFGLHYGDKPVTGVDTPRLQSLMAYLLLHLDAPQPRQYLAFRFWPDSTEKQARTNLRQILHHLRQALPDADHFIESGIHTLRWRPDVPFTLDVTVFVQALARSDQDDPDATQRAIEEAVDLYRGDLLPSCYDEWIEPEREKLRQQYMAALDRLVRLLEQQRAYLEAIHYAGFLVRKDPLRETTYRTLMRLHALCNNRASALRTYHECVTVLERELAVQPGPATHELYERLLSIEAPAECQLIEQPLVQAAELPLVGRQFEWDQLRAAWRTATREHPFFALIAGEAGIGKSRLARELLTWAARQGVTIARTRCYAAEGRLAFAPIADWLRMDAFLNSVEKIDAVWRTEVARILPELLADAPDLSLPESLTESWQRRRFFESLARAVLTASQPMVLLIDDLQWCDQETLEWLHYLLRFDHGARMLLLGTMRIEEVGPEHPLETLLLDLRRSGLVTEIVLGPLGAVETAALAEHLTTRPLEPDETAYLYHETEGNPLFVVESVRAERLSANHHPAKSTLVTASPPAGPETLPPKVHAMLTARLAQCTPSTRELAHLAAVVGRAFTFEVLAKASGRDEDTLIWGLDELWQRRIVREYGPDAYDFSHDKLREVAYAEVSPARRRRLHRRVAEALETIPAIAPDAVSGQLAAHYERAGLPDQAVPWYQRAAQVAQHVYANEEAIIYLNRALSLLDRRPASPQRDTSELALLVLLGSSIAAARGFAASETGRVYTRARTLCRPEEDSRLLFPVYWGSYSFSLVRAELRRALKFSEQCQLLAQTEEDPALLVAAHFSTGVTLAHMGELTRAREHLEQARAHYDPGQRHSQMGTDPGMFSLAYLAHILWLLGYPDQALGHGREALSLAEEAANPFSRDIALSYMTMLHQFRRESEAVSEYAESGRVLANEHGFPYYGAWGTIMKGWALHQQGARDEGKSRMSQGLSDLRAIGTGLREPYYLSLLAEAYGQEGDAEGLNLLTRALRVVDRTDERWQEAELYRLKGDMLLGQNTKESEACYRQALRVARQQEARSLELRAAQSLSRLWQNQHRRNDARRLLKSVCDAFTEGFDAPDLQEAQALLEDLS